MSAAMNLKVCFLVTCLLSVHVWTWAWAQSPCPRRGATPQRSPAAPPCSVEQGSDSGPVAGPSFLEAWRNDCPSPGWAPETAPLPRAPRLWAETNSCVRIETELFCQENCKTSEKFNQKELNTERESMERLTGMPMPGASRIQKSSLSVEPSDPLSDIISACASVAVATSPSSSESSLCRAEGPCFDASPGNK